MLAGSRCGRRAGARAPGFVAARPRGAEERAAAALRAARRAAAAAGGRRWPRERRRGAPSSSTAGVVLDGRWLAAHTVYLDNRQMNGRPGFFVVTPLRLDDGRAVLVQRGWLPRDCSDRTASLPPPTRPTGAVRSRRPHRPGAVAAVRARCRAPRADPAESRPRRLCARNRPAACGRWSIVQLDDAGAPADGLLRAVAAAGARRAQALRLRLSVVRAERPRSRSCMSGSNSSAPDAAAPTCGLKPLALDRALDAAPDLRRDGAAHRAAAAARCCSCCWSARRR